MLVGVAGREYIYDSHLGPYPIQCTSKWALFSSYITLSVLERLNPIGSIIRNTVPERQVFLWLTNYFVIERERIESKKNV